MAHWHDFNPWAADLIYLPSLEEAAALTNGPSDKMIEWWLKESKLHGTLGKLDPYLLRDGPLSRGPREMHLGIRWGKEPWEYFSPHVEHQERALELFLKYGGPIE